MFPWVVKKYVKIAKQNNLYFELDKFSFEKISELMKPFEYIAKGAEGYVYKYENICRKVYKYKAFKSLVKNIFYHNKIFDNKRSIVGFIKTDKLYPIVEQRFIDGKDATFYELKNYLETKSFSYINGYFKSNKYKISMNDFLNGNSLITSQKEVFLVDEKYYSPENIFVKLYMRTILKAKYKFKKINT